MFCYTHIVFGLPQDLRWQSVCITSATRAMCKCYFICCDLFADVSHLTTENVVSEKLKAEKEAKVLKLSLFVLFLEDRKQVHKYNYRI